MSETQEVTSDSNGAFESIDPVLESWVQEANDNGASLSLTLHVGGFLVSGQLIGFKQYLQDLRNPSRMNGKPSLERMWTLLATLMRLPTEFQIFWVHPGSST